MTDRKRQIERLFRQHYRDMYRLACILLHDEQESMDIVHDVFARLLVDSKPLDEATVRSFLLSSVRNQCLNVLTSSTGHPNQSAAGISGASRRCSGVVSRV